MGVSATLLQSDTVQPYVGRQKVFFPSVWKVFLEPSARRARRVLILLCMGFDTAIYTLLYCYICVNRTGKLNWTGVSMEPSSERGQSPEIEFNAV